MSPEDIENLKKAGQIAVQAVAYARTIAKKGILLLELAEKIEGKIEELGGKPAFPVNLSINECAAHATPAYNDEGKAHGLLKIDIGAQVKGFIADTAFSVDLESSEENKLLISAAEEALKKATALVKDEHFPPLREIGKIISETIRAKGAQPIQNLSGHSIEKNEIHAGVTIPNYDNVQSKILDQGVYAIEPFSTSGVGSVRDGKPSGIYALIKEGTVRDTFAREVLKYIKANYETLPFCSRWLHKRFGSRALIALKRIEDSGLVHQYPQLIEQSGRNVAQAEHTIIITDKKVIVTTE